MNEAQIIEKVLSGDVEAYGELVRKYASSLAAVARHLTYCADDAEDLAQEALVDAYRHLASLQDPRKFKAWLFVILRNNCRDYLQRHRPDLVSLDEYTEILTTPEPADTSELVDMLNSLPLADREVLAARYLQELSFQEIAETLGVTTEAARMRCSRARARLRTLTEQRDEARTQRVMGVFLAFPLHADFVEQVMQSARQTPGIPPGTGFAGATGTWWSGGLLKLLGLCGLATLCIVLPILLNHRQASPTVALHAPTATRLPSKPISHDNTRLRQQHNAPGDGNPAKAVTTSRRPSSHKTTGIQPVSASNKRAVPTKSAIPTTNLPTAEKTTAQPINTAEQDQSSERSHHPMEPTIVNREETTLVGLASEGGSIDQLWQAFDVHNKQIKHKATPATYYEVHTFSDDPQSGKAPEYLVSVEVTGVEDVPEGLVVRRLPAGTYAVFTHHLANGGFTGCNETMDTWLKNGPYKLSPNACIQVFDDRFKGPNNPESIIDFLLPVTEKK